MAYYLSLAEARRNAKARLSAQGRGYANANAERLPKQRGNRSKKWADIQKLI